MPIPKLGRIEAIDPREIWKNEAQDFTPWLLENEDVLADALGIDLELENAEHPVGNFSLDLVGRDLTNEAALIVENQLGTSDHSHLGQILTYAGGTDASTIVWVAPNFRQEHQQAIDWLNERTDADTRFFAVQLSAGRIGDSPAAPIFDVVAKPNDWQKQVRAATKASAVSGKGKLYQGFWEKYLEALQTRHPDWTRARPTPYNYLTAASRIRGAYINPVFADRGRLAVMLWIDGGDADRNRELFHLLQEQSDAIETAFGDVLEWDYQEGRKACKIVFYNDGKVEDFANHDSYVDWFIEAGERLRSALDVADVPDWALK